MKILLFGVSQVGKSTVAKVLAKKLNCIFIDPDYYIIDKFGQVRKAFLDPGIIKISDSLILKLRKEDLYSCVYLLEQMKRADMAEPYYDFIIDVNVLSFKSSE